MLKALSAITLAVPVIALLTPIPTAHACGGMFCDSQPTSMPVDQTGETILFVVDGDFVEAHVQIEYDGEDATKFAWIVPVPAIPEIEVGAIAFIDAVRDATVPVYGFTTSNTCDDDDVGDDGGPPPSGFITASDAGGGGGPLPPHVVTVDTVGAFEYAVLSGGTIEGVMTWLSDNGYATDASAEPILGEYLDEGSVFVAFKLDHRAGVEDIHPVVIRYPGDEACIPIRLTRIAAADDMPIRAMFLGETRVMPVGYYHVGLDHVRLDWPSFGANYDELVSMAIDEAGGRAFVTEFAGPSWLVDPEALGPKLAEPAPGPGSAPDPYAAIDLLVGIGALACTTDECVYSHALVRALLSRHLPVPAGLTDAQFYGCLVCWADQIDVAAWDEDAFLADLSSWIVQPRAHAETLLATWPYLTRLYTLISPHEMIFDPRFAVVDGLADVPNRRGAAGLLECCGTVARLPGGRRIGVVTSSGGSVLWPAWPDEMPYAERIEEVDEQGRVLTLADHTADIDRMIDEHNESRACFADEVPPPDDDPDPGATTGANTDGGTDPDDPDEATTDFSRRCGCQTPSDPAPILLGLLGLLGLRRRRRR